MKVSLACVVVGALLLLGVAAFGFAALCVAAVGTAFLLFGLLRDDGSRE